MASSDQVNNNRSHEPILSSTDEVNEANEKLHGESPYFTCSLFDTEKVKCLISGAFLASCTPSFELDLYGSCEPPEEKQSPVSLDLTVPSKMACSVCATDFSSRADQIQHYKLDWHRFNLKEKLKGNAPISETAFDEQAGDISSLSGSDSESESRTSSDVSSSSRHKTRPSAVPDYLRTANEAPGKSSENSSETDDTDDVSPKRTRMQPKVYFQNDSGKVVGLYRCVIHSKQNSPATKEALVTMLNNIPEESNWAVILVGGGHFAGAVFECSGVLEHKTFHRYTVRAKQGSSQGARDGRQGGQHFNSAGSSLRRYNESALTKDIQDLLSTWSPRLQICHRIFYRAPSFNRSILFGGKNPPFKKDDVRLRTIPFPTRRATYSEVRRVHNVLSTLECFGNSAAYKATLPVSPKMHLGARKKKTPSRSDEVVISQDGSSKCSEGSLRNINSKKEEENSFANVDVGPASSSRDEVLTIAEQPEELFPAPHLDPAITSLNESDLPEHNGCDEKSIHDVQPLNVATPPKRKKDRHRVNTLFKRQKDPEADATAGEKYQMKNSLYDACKTGNLAEIQKLLDIITHSKESFSLLNPENSSCSAMQSAITHGEGISAETSHNFCVPCAKSAEAVPATIEPSRNVNTFVNVPSGHAMRTSCVTNTLPPNHEEPIATAVQERRHSSVECRGSSDDRSLTTDLDACTLSDNSSETHYRCCSVPPSPWAQQNKKQRSHSLSSEADSIPLVLSASILNEKINDEGTTLLHVATKERHYSVVKALLESGADPTIRNKKGLTPYMVSPDKEMRNVYRRFMASHPEVYDYTNAQIPSPLTEAQEAEKLEKSKEKKKLKKAKMKEKKILAAELKKEQEEKQRFLSLSDREKRALAAERRYAEQLSGQSSQAKCPVLSRCFSCGLDITGKTPFEYLDYVFCSVSCVKKHRMKASS